MAVIRSIGRRTAVALAMSSALAGCSSVEHDSKLASAQAVDSAKTPGTAATQTASVNGPNIQYSSASQPATGAQVGQAANATQPTVELAKTSRLPVPVPSATETASVQTVAMASATMPAVVPFK